MPGRVIVIDSSNKDRWECDISDPVEQIDIHNVPDLMAANVRDALFQQCFDAVIPGGVLKITLKDIPGIMEGYAKGCLTLKEAFDALYAQEVSDADSFDLFGIKESLYAAGFAVAVIYDTDEHYTRTILARKNYVEGDRKRSDSPNRLYIQSQDLSLSSSCGIIGVELLLAMDRKGLNTFGLERADSKERFDLPDAIKPLIKFNEPNAMHDLLLRFGHVENVDFWNQSKPARQNWAYACHEHTLLPKTWLRSINEYGELFFISEFCADAARASGLNRTMHVMHHGYDPEVFYPKAAPKERWQNEFVFLFVGRGLKRKGIEELIQAFSQQFSSTKEPVRLVIHVAAGLPEAFRQNIRDERISVLDGALDKKDLGNLYRDADCLVHPSYVEGFGLPVLEAKACGLPVIATDFGGYLDFSSAEDTLLVEGKIEPRDRDTPPEVVSHWKRPDIEHLSHLMSQIYEDRALREQIALAGYERVKLMTWGHTILPLLKQLDRYNIR